MPKPPALPDKTAIAAMPPFDALTLEAITVVTTAAEAEAAYATLAACPAVGFDTESKPTFTKGEVATGPHLLQFCSPTHAWLFQSHRVDTLAPALALLQSAQVCKVGFGLKSDLAHLRRRFGIEPVAILDLGDTLRARGYRQEVGAKSAIALLFGQRLAKSKSVGTSNWGSRTLNERQQLYAANDAYAALRAYLALSAQGTPSPPARAPRVRVRAATLADAPAIAAIYAPYVTGSTISFEETPPDDREMAARLQAVLDAGLPYLVATQHGKVIGYCYANRWRQRPAYRGTVESSVYLHAEATGRGVGARLMRALFDALRAQGMHTVVACIALPNPASVALHERLGMQQVAQFREVGDKFGQRLDVGFWQRMLGAEAP